MDAISNATVIRKQTGSLKKTEWKNVKIGMVPGDRLMKQKGQIVYGTLSAGVDG